MAREYGKNWFSMWTDEHFCTGRLFDKLFYQVLIGQSGMNDAGIVPINFRKWRKALRDGDQLPTETDLKASLVRQERRRYVFTDEDTGEVLVRTHIRNDKVSLQPAVLVSALRDLKSCQSAKFAVVMLAELERIELPEISTATKHGERLRDSLKLNHDAAVIHLKTLAEGLQEPLSEPFIEDLPEPFPEPFPRPGKTEPFHQGFQEGSQEPPVVVEVVVAKSPSGDGWVGEVDDASAKIAQPQPKPARNEPPPDRCPKHINDDEPPPCGACAGHRKRRERWDAKQPQRAADARKAFWDGIRAAKCCDPNGKIDDPHGGNALARCPNHDWSVIDHA